MVYDAKHRRPDVYDGEHRNVRWRRREKYSPGVARCRRCGKSSRDSGIVERELHVGYVGNEAVTVIITTGCPACVDRPGPKEPRVNLEVLYIAKVLNEKHRHDG